MDACAVRRPSIDPSPTPPYTQEFKRRLLTGAIGGFGTVGDFGFSFSFSEPESFALSLPDLASLVGLMGGAVDVLVLRVRCAVVTAGGAGGLWDRIQLRSSSSFCAADLPACQKQTRLCQWTEHFRFQRTRERRKARSNAARPHSFGEAAGWQAVHYCLYGARWR